MRTEVSRCFLFLKTFSSHCLNDSCCCSSITKNSLTVFHVKLSQEEKKNSNGGCNLSFLILFLYIQTTRGHRCKKTLTLPPCGLTYIYQSEVFCWPLPTHQKYQACTAFPAHPSLSQAVFVRCCEERKSPF